MSAFGAKTKKVVTYGKKKTRIINIHSDFSPSKDKETPPTTPRRREAPTTPLRPKATNNETPLKPRDNNTPLKAKKTEKGPKDVPLKQHAAQNRRAVYRTSPERAHVVRKPAPRRIHALRAMDRVEVTIETRSPAPKKSEPQPEPQPEPLARATPKEKPEVDKEEQPKPKAKSKEKLKPKPREEEKVKAGPSKPPKVDEVAQQVVDLTLSDEEEPVKRGRAPRKPRKTPKTVKPAVPTPLPTPEPELPPDSAGESLSRLLAQCSVPQPINFDDIFSHPAFSALVKGSQLRKQGEASYSEVFRVGDAVVKVIPLLGTARPTDDEDVEDVPDCSGADDVAREIEVTRRMAQVPGGGFVGFRGAFVVTGLYPAPLLAEWDAWKAERGTESPRPVFPQEQQFALVVLDDGGGDLESAHFDSHSWTTMAAVFWQVCDALARAEKWTQFEHRDLHEGQILLNVTAPLPPTSKPTAVNYLAPSGVTATIIDFGLSRLTLDGEVRWTPLPEEVYDGVGAQWDVYRAMRDVIESQPREPEVIKPPSPVPLARRRSRRTTTRVVQYILSDSEDSDDEAYVPPSPSLSPPGTPSSSRFSPSTAPTTPSPAASPWTAFVPASNVLWLRYLCAYLLKAARKPYARKSASAAKEAARQRQEAAWSMLHDVGDAFASDVNMFESAADVRSWGEECGWVR